MLGLLQTFEKDHQLYKQPVNFVGGSISGGRRSLKKGKKKKNKKVHHAPVQTERFKPDQSNAEYFFCKKKGHWKRNCSLYIATLDPNRQNKGRCKLLLGKVCI